VRRRACPSSFLPFSLFGMNRRACPPGVPVIPVAQIRQYGYRGSEIYPGVPVSFINLFHLADIPNNLTSSFLARSHHLKTERKELTMKSSLGPGAQKNSCSMLNRIEKGKETHQFHE